MTEFEQKHRDFSKETLKPLFQKTTVSINYRDLLSQPWDTSDQRTFLQKKLELLRMVGQLRKKPADEVEPDLEVTTDNMLEPSSSIEELKQEVELFIEKQPARGHMQQWKENTTSQYLGCDQQTSFRTYLSKYKSMSQC
jgi:hypothetical protein